MIMSGVWRVESPERLDIADHVYIGPFNLIDASGGLAIGEGVQITSHCSLVTHASHRSQRPCLTSSRNWEYSSEPRVAWRVLNWLNTVMNSIPPITTW